MFKVLLIGGKSDGRWMKLEALSETLLVPYNEPIPVTNWLLGEPMPMPEVINYHVDSYELDAIIADNWSCQFYRHESLSRAQTISRLLKGYRCPVIVGDPS